MSYLSRFASTEKRLRALCILSCDSDLGSFPSVSFPSSSFFFFRLLRLSFALLELSLEASEELSVPPTLSPASPPTAAAAASAA